jgi:hypothetical protein
MGCDINGSGCKVCPGMWIAGLVLLVMALQSLFFRSSAPPRRPSADSAIQTQEANDPSVRPD